MPRRVKSFFTPWAKKRFKVRVPAKPTGVRFPRIKIEPPLPYLGPHTSKPEQIVAAALTQRHEVWQEQEVVAGGRELLGGMVVDFKLPYRRMYLRIQGEHFHGSAGQIARDDMDAVLLRAQGYTVIDLWVRDILADVEGLLDRTIGRPG